MKNTVVDGVIAIVGPDSDFWLDQWCGSGSGRIRIQLGPWIRIQGYESKGKQSLTDKFLVFFCRELYFSSLKLKKVAYL